MKSRLKILAVITALLVFFVSILSGGISSNDTNQCKSKEDMQQVLKVEGDLTQVVYFSKPRLTTMEVEYESEGRIISTTFTRVTLQDTFSIGRAGAPELPVYPCQLVIPQGMKVANIRLVCLDSHDIKTDINLKRNPVYPYQPPIPIGHRPPETLVMDKGAYRTPGFTSLWLGGGMGEQVKSSQESPEKGKKTVIVGRSGWKEGYCRGYRILSVNIRPVQYEPVTGKILYHQKIAISVHLEPDEYNPFYRNNPDDARWVKSLVINDEVVDSYDPLINPLSFYEGGICDPSEDYEYVIITSEELNETTERYTWNDLIDRKMAKGLTARKITIEGIDACSDYWNDKPIFNDTQAHMREFIKDAYLDWETNYILLGGDEDGEDYDVPSRKMDVPCEHDINADIYFNHLDDSWNEDEDDFWGEHPDDDIPGTNDVDLYAELFIGRIPVDNGIQISNWLTKSFYYEDATEKDYLENAVFFGGDLGYYITSADYMEEIRNGTGEWHGTNTAPRPSEFGYTHGFLDWNDAHPEAPYNVSIRLYYDRDASIPTDYKEVINSDNACLINHMSHGDYYMALDMQEEELRALKNTKPLFSYSQGCRSGDFDAADEGALGAWLTYDDTSGGFACVWNAGYGWLHPRSTNGSSQWLHSLFWEYIFNASSSTIDWHLGATQAFSKDKFAPLALLNRAWHTGFRGVYYGCLLFGDPEQCIKPPVKPEHNIGISKLIVSDHEPADTDIWVNATIYNNGKNNEVNVEVKFLVNDTLEDSTNIPFFERDTIREVSFLYHTPPVGWETLCINITPVSEEKITVDNQKCREVIYGPDIAVVGIEAPDYLPQGSIRPVTGLVCNVGPTDESNIVIQLIAKGIVVNNTTIDLNRGDCMDVTFMWDCSVTGIGVYDVVVHAVPVAGESYMKNQNKRHTVEVFKPLGNILLVDDDYNELMKQHSDYERYYELALYAAHYNVKIWNTHDDGLIYANIMERYDAVVWETGDNGVEILGNLPESLSYQERVEIDDYLNDKEGKLFISGQGIASYLNSLPDWDKKWLNKTLHTQFEIENTENYIIDGISDDPIGRDLKLEIQDGDGANNQIDMDGISPTADASACFEYHDSPYKAGVRYKGEYTVVFFSFGFEAINKWQDRKEVMERIVRWVTREYEIATVDHTPLTNLTLNEVMIKDRNCGLSYGVRESRCWKNFSVYSPVKDLTEALYEVSNDNQKCDRRLSIITISIKYKSLLYSRT